MLVVTIKPNNCRSRTRAYATQSNVLEVLNALCRAAETNETVLFTPRLINGFSADERLDVATVIVKTVEVSKFSLDDTVIVHYTSGSEYYRMREVARLFSDLT